MAAGHPAARRDWLAGLLDFAGGAGHPLASEVRAVLRAVSGRRVSTPTPRPKRSTRSPPTASGASRCRARLRLAPAIAQGYPAASRCRFTPAIPEERLDTAFAGAAFEIEHSEIVSRAAVRRRGGAIHYRSLCLGHERVMSERPARLLGDAAAASDGDLLVEVGVFAFVARRRR